MSVEANLDWCIERVRWGSIGDLRRMQRFGLLEQALSVTAEAGLLAPERKAELVEQLGWFADTAAVVPALSELATGAAAEPEAGEETEEIRPVRFHSDHPLPTRKQVKRDATGVTVIFTYD